MKLIPVLPALSPAATDATKLPSAQATSRPGPVTSSRKSGRIRLAGPSFVEQAPDLAKEVGLTALAAGSWAITGLSVAE